MSRPDFTSDGPPWNPESVGAIAIYGREHQPRASREIDAVGPESMHLIHAVAIASSRRRNPRYVPITWPGTMGPEATHEHDE